MFARPSRIAGVETFLVMQIEGRLFQTTRKGTNSSADSKRPQMIFALASSRLESVW
jgi:hypothetical protein